MNLKPFTLAVTYWIVVIILAHSFVPPGYRWTQNTISELASQGHTYQWIMQAGLMGFGLLVMLAVALTGFKAKKMILPLIPVALYGLAIFLSGIYCAAPIDPSIAYSSSEAELHSAFATLAGLSLSVGILWRIFLMADGREKLAHTLFLFGVIGFSVLFGLTESEILPISKGIVQRFLYLSGFAWLIYQEGVLSKKISHEKVRSGLLV